LNNKSFYTRYATDLKNNYQFRRC